MRCDRCPRSSLVTERALTMVSVVLASVIVGACGDPTDGSGLGADVTMGVDNSVVEPVVVVLREPDSGDLDDVGIGGLIVVDDDCFYLDGPAGNRSVIAWPHGTTWNPATQSVERPGGIGPYDDPPFEFAIGDYFRAAGTTVSRAEALTEVAPGSAESLDRCLEADVALIRADVRADEPPSSVPATTTLTELVTSESPTWFTDAPYALASAPGWTLQEAVDPGPDNPASLARPPMEWYVEYLDGNALVVLAGHAVGIDDTRAELESLGFAFEEAQIAGFDRALEGRSIVEVNGATVVLLDTGTGAISLHSYDADSDQLRSLAATVGPASRSAWLAVGGVIL